MNNPRVKLYPDLTHIHPKLIPGSEGVAKLGAEIQTRGLFGAAVKVDFDCGTSLDILWDGLEVIDVEYSNVLKSIEKEQWENYLTATEVVLTVGPRGGRKGLSFKTKKGTINLGYGGGYTTLGHPLPKTSEILDFFEKNGVEVKEILQ